MHETEWKDRGWWVSVEFEKQRFNRKKFSKALALLGDGGERYDMILENGKTMARSIFSKDSNMSSLAGLLNIAGRWTGTVVHVNGQKLDASVLNRFNKLLDCTSQDAFCQLQNKEKRYEFLGCHLLQIGLLNYSLRSLKKGARYWFSFYKKEKGSNQCFILDKAALKKDFGVSELCPMYPENTKLLIDKLPLVVDLYAERKFTIWTLTKHRFRTRWASRFPPIVPYSSNVYECWMRRLLKIDKT